MARLEVGDEIQAAGSNLMLVEWRTSRFALGHGAFGDHDLVNDGRSDGDVPVLSVLCDAEKAAVLDELVTADSRLRASAESAARRRLASVDRAGVSDAVVEVLTALDQEALGTRAGRTRYGYVEPTEAAWALLEEALQPWIEDIRRLSRIGLAQAARETGLGILGGLHRLEHARDDDLLLSWAPDFPAETAFGVLRALADAGVELSHAGMQRAAPGWS